MRLLRQVRARTAPAMLSSGAVAGGEVRKQLRRAWRGVLGGFELRSGTEMAEVAARGGSALLRAVVAAALQRPSSNAATVVSSCVHTSSVPAWLRGSHGGLFIAAGELQ